MNLVLASGRTIKLEELRQWKTYGGLLAGVPDRDMNDGIVGRALNTAAEAAMPDWKPFLIPPRTTVGSRKEPRKEERLPPVACTGIFCSDEIANSGEPYSMLIIVWFQDEFGPPIANDVQTAIQQLDWDSIAYEWCS